MSHRAQVRFCMGLRQRLRKHFRNKRVLDVGSLDVNGSNRGLFEGGEYIGCDFVAGKNVDFVGRPEDVEGTFDVVISTEALEHDPQWQKTLGVMLEKLRPGGLLILTCAGPGRPEHGTRQCPIPGMDNTSDYYRNLDQLDVLPLLPSSLWQWSECVVNNDFCDLYFWGIRKVQA